MVWTERQSAKLFSSRQNWDSPNPSPAGECAPPPGSGGRGTHIGERGVGRVPIPIPTRGHTLWYSLYTRTLWGGQKLAFPRGNVASCSVSSEASLLAWNSFITTKTEFLPRYPRRYSCPPHGWSLTSLFCQIAWCARLLNITIILCEHLFIIVEHSRRLSSLQLKAQKL